MIISGIVGISIGDTLYINALKIIGTRKTLSFEALTPIIATTLGTWSIDEIYPQKVWVGSLIVSFSLLMIVRQNTFQKDHSNLILSTLLGTNFGILFQQIVFKFLPIGIGWTLLSLSPIFALFISKREGEEINKLTIFYSFLSFIGVAITLI